MKKIVVLSGAGMSAESGIRTFRDSNGLWEDHDIMEVASPVGWQKDPALVLNFYNQRRKNVLEAQPNKGHLALSALEEEFDVTIITQNIDDLHERAGSTHVIHLHGEILKSKSSIDGDLVYEATTDLNLGDLCEKGSQLRPHVVWFGEQVPMMDVAMDIVSTGDVLLVIGTSLNVYPAAGLINYALPGTARYLVDPNIPDATPNGITCIAEPATTGVKKAIYLIRQGI